MLQNLSPHSKHQICLTNPGPYKYTHTKDVQLCLPHYFHFQLFSLLRTNNHSPATPPPNALLPASLYWYTRQHTLEYSSNFTPIESSESIRLDIDIRVKTIQIGKRHFSILPFCHSPLLHFSFSATVRKKWFRHGIFYRLVHLLPSVQVAYSIEKEKPFLMCPHHHRHRPQRMRSKHSFPHNCTRPSCNHRRHNQSMLCNHWKLPFKNKCRPGTNGVPTYFYPLISRQHH